MFYVANGHIYLTEKDAVSEKYTEVELIVTSIEEITTSNVNFALQVKGEGVATKPEGRSVCGMEELIAKFGDEAIEYYELPTYTVTFDKNGHGTAPKAQEVKEGYKATAPTAPTAEGYTFGGWYKEAAVTNAWNFSEDVVEEDTTLYAKWTENAPAEQTEG